MKITGLSLDSQLAILSELSSHTLLSAVPLVCARWNQLQPHACRQRRTVKLIIRPNPQPAASRHFTLYPAPLDTTYAIALLFTFPRITHLVIYHLNFSFDSPYLQLHFLHLLQSWTSTLVSLHLTDHDSKVHSRVSTQFDIFFYRLLALLNQMPHLKRLGLDTDGQLPPSADLSGILSRLVDVELNFCSSEHLLVPQLLQHCSPNLQRLSLGSIRHFPDFLPLLTSPFICSKLEGLEIDNFDATQLAITFDHCSGLRALKLFLISLEDYAERMHLLTKLPCLTELTLTLWQFPIDWNGLLFPVIAPTPLPVLSTIRQLNILAWSLFYIPSHEYFIQATQLDQVFPQLQQIELNWIPHRSCFQCAANNLDPNNCIDALLRPVARLETLQVATVCMKGNDFDWLPRLRPQ